MEIPHTSQHDMFLYGFSSPCCCNPKNNICYLPFFVCTSSRNTGNIDQCLYGTNIIPNLINRAIDCMTVSHIRWKGICLQSLRLQFTYIFIKLTAFNQWPPPSLLKPEQRHFQYLEHHPLQEQLSFYIPKSPP